MDDTIRLEIERRILELEDEGARVVKAASEQAAAPYNSAIGELKRLLVIIGEQSQNHTT